MSKADSNTPSPSLTRRRVFAGAGTAGALAAVAAAVPLARRDDDVVATAAKPEPEGAGYRETAHVLRYYETTRV